MSTRRYTLVDVPVQRRLWPDLDAIVRVMEHVRRNLHALAPDLPADCEVDLLAALTAHNVESQPVLGVYLPPAANAAPILDALNLVVSAWCDDKSDEELRAIARATEAPTWAELVKAGSHPKRQTALRMDVPDVWRDYECRDYFESPLAEEGWWDEGGQYWYIEPAERVREDGAREFLIIGGPGVDGIRWGYRKRQRGIWAYYPIEDEFVLLADSATALREGYGSGRIKV